MWRRTLWFIGMASLSIALAACQPAGQPSDEEPAGEQEDAAAAAPEEEAAEPVEPPTEPAQEDEQALTQTHRAEEGGYSFDLPEEWVAVSFFGISMAAESQATIDQWQQNGQYPDVPVITVAMGAPADFGGDFGSPEEMASQMATQNVGLDEPVTVGEPTGLTVGGLPAAAVDFSGTPTETDQEYAGRLVAILDGDRAGMVIGVAPPDQWSDFSPVFDAIVASMQFFEPNPEAGASAPQDSEGSGAESVLAGVDSVEVFVSESAPPQVYAQAGGTLPNFCTTIGEITQTRDGNTFTVTVGTAIDESPGCADSGPVSFGEDIPLDVAGLPAGQYTVDVNGVTGTFQLGGSSTSSSGSSSVAQSSTCGDGTCSSGENAATCPADCGQATSAGASCGNGIVEAGEECEPPSSLCAAIVCEYSDCNTYNTAGNEACVSWSVTLDPQCSSSCTCVSEMTCEDILP